MLKLTILIIILVSGFMLYAMGYNDGFTESERHLIGVYRVKYNVGRG